MVKQSEQNEGPGSGGPVVPEPEAMRAELDGLAAEERKVIGGMIVAMMREPDKLRDREWLLEAYSHIASQALELGDERLEELREWIRSHRDTCLNASFRLFLRVARDLETREPTDEDGQPVALTLGQATIVAMTYFGSDPSGGPAPA
ncbi:MAG: hypothetical protein P1V81_06770 [Planctomycetota bacterium]|nr:hypothetical protein [Planctomycetota bacterium]